MKVLIADDDAAIRLVLRKMLARAYEVEVAEADSGSDTFLKVSLESPDLVLLDWNMPFKDGLSLLEELRAADYDVPVVMVTASADPAGESRARAAGVVAYLRKPFTASQLRAAVDPVLAGCARRAPEGGGGLTTAPAPDRGAT
ncbi:MAG: response regulator [Planctomycetes bacterium]|nr:response regulator [Planctomycetota bacterium]